MARGTSIEEITREQLTALKEKFELVQGDRRAFFDTYETTKKNNEVRRGANSGTPRCRPFDRSRGRVTAPDPDRAPSPRRSCSRS